MKRFVGGIGLAALALAFAAKPAAAQLAGNVVQPALPGTGVTISGDFATGLNDDAKIGGEAPMYFGGRVRLGLPMFAVWAGGGMYPKSVTGVDSKVTFGGGVGINLLKGPALPVTISPQAGIGYYKDASDIKMLNVPLGVLVVINVPSPALNVKPWIYPRAEIVNISNGASSTKVGAGASAGLNISLPMGFGGQVAVDWMTIKYEGATVATKPLMFGASLHYNISVPSLGM